MKSVRTLPGPRFVLDGNRVQIVPPSALWIFVHQHLAGLVVSIFIIAASVVVFLEETAGSWRERLSPVVFCGLGVLVLGHTLKGIMRDFVPGRPRAPELLGEIDATLHDPASVTSLPVDKITASTMVKKKKGRTTTSWAIVLKLQDGSKVRHPLRSKRDLDEVVHMLVTAGMRVEQRDEYKTAGT